MVGTMQRIESTVQPQLAPCTSRHKICGEGISARVSFEAAAGCGDTTGAFLGGANCTLAVESRASGMGPT